MNSNKLYKKYCIVHKLIKKRAIEVFKEQDQYKDFDEFYFWEVHGYGFVLHFINGDEVTHIHINEKQYLTPREFKDIIKKFSIPNKTKIIISWG